MTIQIPRRAVSQVLPPAAALVCAFALGWIGRGPFHQRELASAVLFVALSVWFWLQSPRGWLAIKVYVGVLACVFALPVVDMIVQRLQTSHWDRSRDVQGLLNLLAWTTSSCILLRLVFRFRLIDSQTEVDGTVHSPPSIADLLSLSLATAVLIRFHQFDDSWRRISDGMTLAVACLGMTFFSVWILRRLPKERRKRAVMPIFLAYGLTTFLLAVILSGVDLAFRNWSPGYLVQTSFWEDVFQWKYQLKDHFWFCVIGLGGMTLYVFLLVLCGLKHSRALEPTRELRDYFRRIGQVVCFLWGLQWLIQTQMPVNETKQFVQHGWPILSEHTMRSDAEVSFAHPITYQSHLAQAGNVLIVLAWIALLYGVCFWSRLALNNASSRFQLRGSFRIAFIGLLALLPVLVVSFQVIGRYRVFQRHTLPDGVTLTERVGRLDGWIFRLLPGLSFVVEAESFQISIAADASVLTSSKRIHPRLAELFRSPRLTHVRMPAIAGVDQAIAELKHSISLTSLNIVAGEDRTGPGRGDPLVIECFPALTELAVDSNYPIVGMAEVPNLSSLSGRVLQPKTVLSTKNLPALEGLGITVSGDEPAVIVSELDRLRTLAVFRMNRESHQPSIVVAKVDIQRCPHLETLSCFGMQQFDLTIDNRNELDGAIAWSRSEIQIDSGGASRIRDLTIQHTGSVVLPSSMIAFRDVDLHPELQVSVHQWLPGETSLIHGIEKLPPKQVSQLGFTWNESTQFKRWLAQTTPELLNLRITKRLESNEEINSIPRVGHTLRLSGEPQSGRALGRWLQKSKYATQFEAIGEEAVTLSMDHWHQWESLRISGPKRVKFLGVPQTKSFPETVWIQPESIANAHRHFEVDLSLPKVDATEEQFRAIPFSAMRVVELGKLTKGIFDAIKLKQIQCLRIDGEGQSLESIDRMLSATQGLSYGNYWNLPGNLGDQARTLARHHTELSAISIAKTSESPISLLPYQRYFSVDVIGYQVNQDDVDMMTKCFPAHDVYFHDSLKDYFESEQTP